MRIKTRPPIFGSVVEILVADITSTANVRIHTDRSARKTHENYFAFADYHDCAVVLARVDRPKDKVAVKSVVDIMHRWVIEYLEVEQFSSLAELNEAVATQLHDINAKPFRGSEPPRFTELEQFEAEHRRALPEKSRKQLCGVKPKLGSDHQTQLDHRFY